MIFPPSGTGSRLVLDFDTLPGRLPTARWLGTTFGSGEPAAALLGAQRGTPLLPEHARGTLTRPGLRGCRAGGGDWSPAFLLESVEPAEHRLTMLAEDAGLRLRTELETLPGGALRIRHVLTNLAADPYHLDGLEVAVPVPDGHVELLDFTGRHLAERVPQRAPLRDGLWLRESRGGRPGHDAATVLVAGTPGFGFGSGELIALSVATSGNAVHYAQRSAVDDATLGGGELLLPGEIVLVEGASYATPWVVVMATHDGLDGAAAALHTWQRSLPAHPAAQPVTLNVWEAVYFDHDLARLTALADRAARIGVERFVLDDGWFRARRDDTAGLGDWYVDESVWPAGLGPLIEHVARLGMQFGLWFEPEMINPDSELFRAHPDWVLAAGARLPELQRHQLVLDLTNGAAWQYLFDRLAAVLRAYPIQYVKWDHNRSLVEAGSPARRFAPAGHEQTLAFYRLLDALRVEHPQVAFESCASGGARIDLGVLERVQRVWTSDMTDALARQRIQQWTVQLAAPEYLGAHVSSPTSHQSGRTFALGFRAATALFGAFGIEWDLTEAAEAELAELAEWVALHKRWRPVLHSGRVVRLDVADPAVLAHGVVAADRRSALLAHVQLDESASNRGVVLRVPGLEPDRGYRLSWAMAPDPARVSGSPALDPAGPTGGVPVSGADLERVGVWVPRRRPEQVLLIALEVQGNSGT